MPLQILSIQDTEFNLMIYKSLYLVRKDLSDILFLLLFKQKCYLAFLDSLNNQFGGVVEAQKCWELGDKNNIILFILKLHD